MRELEEGRAGGRGGRGGAAIVVLTGAGISVEFGLPSFRGAGGLWQGRRLEEVATPEAFARDPALVQRFYDERRRQLLDPAIRPNPAHLALAALERDWPERVVVVTQNIDDLHERAGTQRLIHMHGELLKARCTACAAVCPWLEDLAGAHRCPGCARPDCLRPHVVWFGEMPLELDRDPCGARGLHAVRRGRHLGPGLPGRGLRRGGAPRGPGPHHRAQPRAERGQLEVCRAAPGPRRRARAGPGRGAPGRPRALTARAWPRRLSVDDPRTSVERIAATIDVTGVNGRNRQIAAARP